jgi:hypothetical protein
LLILNLLREGCAIIVLLENVMHVENTQQPFAAKNATFTYAIFAILT